MAARFHDGREVIHDVAHKRSLVWVMMPHALHQIYQLETPMLGQCSRLGSADDAKGVRHNDNDTISNR